MFSIGSHIARCFFITKVVYLPPVELGGVLLTQYKKDTSFVVTDRCVFFECLRYLCNVDVVFNGILLVVALSDNSIVNVVSNSTKIILFKWVGKTGFF